MVEQLAVGKAAADLVQDQDFLAALFDGLEIEVQRLIFGLPFDAFQPVQLGLAPAGLLGLDAGFVFADIFFPFVDVLLLLLIGFFQGFLLLGSDGWELAPVDICFPVLHGKHGEDGTIQSLLEFLGIPFVGSPASVCHRAWNKDALHSSLAKYRDLTGEEGCASWPQGVYLARDAFKGMGAATALDMVADRVIGGYPVCVKPAHGGSALGIHKVESQEELGEAVLDALSYDEAVNIEQWVDGVELSVSILGTGWDAHALPPVEIVAREGFYDATARMADDTVEFFCPVRDESLSPNAADAQAIRAEIERAALEVYRAYSVRDLGRVDLIWDGGAARCFEVDVSPGMTERSLFPMACAAAGLSLPAVLDSLVNEAYARGACF